MTDQPSLLVSAQPADGEPRFVRPRLVVELAPRVVEQLSDLTKIEEANKTTVVNKTIQLLHLIRTLESSGNHVEIVSEDGETRTRLEILQ